MLKGPYKLHSNSKVSSLDSLEQLSSKVEESEGDCFVLEGSNPHGFDLDYFQENLTDGICASVFWSENTGDKMLEVDEQMKIIKYDYLETYKDAFNFGPFLFFNRSDLEKITTMVKEIKFFKIKCKALPFKIGKIKALFLDRDGVINEDEGYVYQKEKFIFKEGVIEFLKKAQSLSYQIHVLTNQSGIARGYYNESDVNKLHSWVNDKLEHEGVHIESWNFCPYHRSKGLGDYQAKSFTRKPHCGMILRLSRTYGFDFKKSLMVGDKVSDHLNLDGIKYYLMKGNYELKEAKTKIVESFDEIELSV